MNKRLGIILIIYFVWISIFRTMSKGTPQWYSLYFIVEDALIAYLLWEVRIFIFSKKVKGLLMTGIIFKSFMVLYDIIRYTSSYEKYLEARKSYLWNTVSVLLIVGCLIVTLINRKR